MKPEEIEKLSLDELQRIAEDPQIVVPDGLADRLQDIAGAALLAARGPAALDDLSRPAPIKASRRPARRWLWGAVPAVALAALSLVLYFRRPAPITLDPEVQATYAQVELAFESFCDAAKAGYDAFSENPFSR